MCQFQHTQSSSSSPSSAAEAGAFRAPKKETPCRFYAKGLCTHGADDCEYSHASKHMRQLANVRWEASFDLDERLWLAELPAGHEQLWNAVPVKDSKRLRRASQLNGYTYHRYTTAAAAAGRRFLGPATWPALETSRLYAMEKLFRQLADWQQQLGVHLHPSVFEFDWVLGHIEARTPAAGSDSSGGDGFDDDVLPSNGLDGVLSAADLLLAERLTEAGCTAADAERAVRDLHERALQFRRELAEQAAEFDPRKHVGVVTTQCVNERFFHLACGKRALKISAAHYAKLCAMWMTHRARQPALGTVDDDIYCLLARHLALSGGGSQTAAFHAAAAPAVFRVVHAHFGAPAIECFASPLNAHYSRFCSLSLDVDYKFGSLGSFFHLAPSRGVFFAHPPAVQRLVDAAAAHVAHLLAAAAAARHALTFLLLTSLPPSHDLPAAARGSDVVRRDVVLEPSTYAFCNGHQHRKDPEQLFHAPYPWQSTVYILQSPRAAKKHPVSDEFVARLVDAFAVRSTAKRDQHAASACSEPHAKRSRSSFV